MFSPIPSLFEESPRFLNGNISAAVKTSVKSIPSLLALIPLLFVSFPGALQAQTATATSDVEGYCTVTLAAGGGALVPVFVNPSSYSASSTVSGQTFSATNLTPGSFNTVSNNPAYFVEVCTGSYAGNCYNVVSNNATSIIVSGLPVALNGQTINIKVRPQVTLDSVANNSTGFSSYADSFNQYLSSNNVASYIYSSGGVLASDYSTPSGGVVVPPGTGILVNNAATSSVVFTGEIDTNNLVVPLNAGTTLVGPMDPQGGNSVTNMNLAPSMAAYADSASLISTDGTLGVTTFYSDGTQLLDANYTPLTPSNAPTVGIGNGFVINAGANGSWTNISVLSN
jgi:hypothetical protein